MCPVASTVAVIAPTVIVLLSLSCLTTARADGCAVRAPWPSDRVLSAARTRRLSSPQGSIRTSSGPERQVRAWSSSINLGRAISSSAWGKMDVTVSFDCLVVVVLRRVFLSPRPHCDVMDAV